MARAEGRRQVRRRAAAAGRQPAISGIGATDRHAASITHRPVHCAEVLDALYRHLGIDPAAAWLVDHAGPPQYPLDRPNRCPNWCELPGDGLR